MEAKQVEQFLIEDNVRVGDNIRFSQNTLMGSQTIFAQLIHDSLEIGNKVFKIDEFTLNLLNPGPYLILWNGVTNNVFAANVDDIENIEVESRRGFDKSDFYLMLKKYNLKRGDLVSYVLTNNMFQLKTLLDTDLLTRNNEDFFVVFESGQGGADLVPLDTIQQMSKG